MCNLGLVLVPVFMHVILCGVQISCASHEPYISDIPGTKDG